MEANYQLVGENLEQAVNYIQKAMQLSMEDIGGDRQKEQKYIDLWVQYTARINEEFLSESKKTGNPQIARNIKKYIMNQSKLFNIFPISMLWGD